MAWDQYLCICLIPTETNSGSVTIKSTMIIFFVIYFYGIPHLSQCLRMRQVIRKY